MVKKYIENQVFKDIKLNPSKLDFHEYEDCSFIDCQVEHNISESIFSNCMFSNCTMSNVKFLKCTLRNSSFKDCNLVGLDISQINPFSERIKFSDCIMDFVIMENVNIHHSEISNCNLKEAQIVNTNLMNSKITDSNLSGTVFDICNLENVDFSNSVFIEIDPENNRLKGAKFNPKQLEGLLTKHRIIVED